MFQSGTVVDTKYKRAKYFVYDIFFIRHYVTFTQLISGWRFTARVSSYTRTMFVKAENTGPILHFPERYIKKNCKPQFFIHLGIHTVP